MFPFFVSTCHNFYPSYLGSNINKSFHFFVSNSRNLQVIRSVRLWFLKMVSVHSRGVLLFASLSGDRLPRTCRVTSTLLNTFRDCSFKRCLSHSSFLHRPFNVRIALPSDAAAYSKRTKPQLHRKGSLCTNTTFVSDPTMCNAAT